jgi:hypothetical protein
MPCPYSAWISTLCDPVIRVLWLMSPPVAMLAWSAFIGAPGGARGTACRARTAASISGVPPVVNAVQAGVCNISASTTTGRLGTRWKIGSFVINSAHCCASAVAACRASGVFKPNPRR